MLFRLNTEKLQIKIEIYPNFQLISITEEQGIKSTNQLVDPYDLLLPMFSTETYMMPQIDARYNLHRVKHIMQQKDRVRESTKQAQATEFAITKNLLNIDMSSK